MSNELEPVPVRCGCGGEAEVYSMGNNKLMTYYIQCEDCGTKTSMFRTITEATRVWNKAMSAKDIDVPNKVERLVNEFEEILAHVRERTVSDCVCGLCEYDGAYMGQSGDWMNECPGFDKDDCFVLKKKYRKEWLDMKR